MTIGMTNELLEGDVHAIQRWEEQPGFKPESSMSEISRLLAKHQAGMKEWDGHSWATTMQTLATRLIARFKLEVSDLAFCVEKHEFRGFVRFRRGTNGLGIRGEVQLNTRHLKQAANWQVLASLLVALLQAWQQEHGKPGGRQDYYNAELRRKARECGLDLRADGSIRLLLNGEFVVFMDGCGIPVPDGEELGQPIEKQRGDSKLKKWSCQACKPVVNARVATSDFQALCLKCRTRFLQQGKTPDGSKPSEPNERPSADTSMPREKQMRWAKTLFDIATCQEPNTQLIAGFMCEITGLSPREVFEFIEKMARDAIYLPPNKDARSNSTFV
jgi:hypothetical protein